MFAASHGLGKTADDAASPRGRAMTAEEGVCLRRVRAAQTISTGNTGLLFQGHDDADAERRLAVRHHLPRHEFDAVAAHATLDEAEGTSHD